MARSPDSTGYQNGYRPKTRSTVTVGVERLGVRGLLLRTSSRRPTKSRDTRLSINGMIQSFQTGNEQPEGRKERCLDCTKLPQPPTLGPYFRDILKTYESKFQLLLNFQSTLLRINFDIRRLASGSLCGRGGRKRPRPASSSTGTSIAITTGRVSTWAKIRVKSRSVTTVAIHSIAGWFTSGVLESHDARALSTVVST